LVLLTMKFVKSDWLVVKNTIKAIYLRMYAKLRMQYSNVPMAYVHCTVMAILVQPTVTSSLHVNPFKPKQ